MEMSRRGRDLSACMACRFAMQEPHQFLSPIYRGEMGKRENFERVPGSDRVNGDDRTEHEAEKGK